MGYISSGSQVRNIHFGIANGLKVNESGLVIDSIFNGSHVC